MRDGFPERPAAPARFRILNAEPSRFSNKAKAALQALGIVVEAEANREYLLSNAHRYDVLFVALRNVIDKEILSRAASLKCIVTTTTGVNHIDVNAARERHIDVLSLLGETKFLENVTATAELTWGLLLSLIRKIPTAHASVVQGRWARDDFYGIQLKGKTLGVIGYGRLGKMVAAYGRAFRMSVIAFDRNQDIGGTEIELVALDDLLRRSEVVSVHLPLTDETRGLFSRQAFNTMKRGAIFINTSRGEIVDELALVEALRSRQLSGAAVDVLAEEATLVADWQLKSPLALYAKSNPDVLITPHIGGVTHESVEETNLFMIKKLAQYLNTSSPRNPAL